jgi:hypothetical protein
MGLTRDREGRLLYGESVPVIVYLLCQSSYLRCCSQMMVKLISIGARACERKLELASLVRRATYSNLVRIRIPGRPLAG